MNRALPTSVSGNGQPSNRDPVASYLDELNVLWKQAEVELEAMHVSVPIKVEIKAEYGGVYDAGSGSEPGWLDTVYLGWRKLAKDWRLCVGVLTDHLDGDKPTCDWKTIAESPKEFRIELAEHYAKLKAKVKEARENLVPQAEAAIASLKQALGEEPAEQAANSENTSGAMPAWRRSVRAESADEVTEWVEHARVYGEILNGYLGKTIKLDHFRKLVEQEIGKVPKGMGKWLIEQSGGAPHSLLGNHDLRDRKSSKPRNKYVIDKDGTIHVKKLYVRKK